MRIQTVVKVRALDIKESVKILQFRFGRNVGFRPVVVGPGIRCHPIDGKLRPGSEIIG